MITNYIFEADKTAAFHKILYANMPYSKYIQDDVPNMQYIQGHPERMRKVNHVADMFFLH